MQMENSSGFVKEPLLFKRPVIEFDDKLVVAWDEEKYKKIFIIFLIFYYFLASFSVSAIINDSSSAWSSI